jgi:hypothetical protein
MLNSEYVEMRQAINRAFPVFNVEPGAERERQKAHRTALYATLGSLRRKEWSELHAKIIEPLSGPEAVERLRAKIRKSSNYGLTDQQRLDRIREDTNRRLNGKRGKKRS